MIYCPKCQVNLTDHAGRYHTCLDEKVCIDCGQNKPIGEFPSHASSYDGHKLRCNICWDKHKKADVVIKREQRRQYREQSRQEHYRRQHENVILREHGYRWRKTDEKVGDDDEYGCSTEEVWQLYTPQGNPIEIEEALAEIEHIGEYTKQSKAPIGNIADVTQWASELIQRNPLILDTETTGFGKQAEVIEMAIVDIAGQILMKTLIKCQDRIQPGASRVHGITDDMLKSSNIPTFPQVLNWIKAHIGNDKELVIYNSEYDLMVLRNTAKRYDLTFPAYRTHCLMLQYSAYVGELGNYGDYLHQKLDKACSEFGIERASHRALGDAQAARQVLLKLAVAKTIV
jgi:DNA polymerase III subunit epsilon